MDLHQILNAVSRDERVKLNENFDTIKNNFTALQRELDLLATDTGGSGGNTGIDYSETMNQINIAINNMNTLINNFIHRGAWDTSIQYQKYNSVSLNGSTYRALADNVNTPVTNSNVWLLVAQKGETGEKGEKGETGSDANISSHVIENAPHQYGGKFEWRYNSTTNSLDLVVLQ